MRGLFLLPTVYRLNASELAATKVETSLQPRTIIRSTPTETQSMSENDFECFASTGEKSPGTMFPDSGPVDIRFSRYRLPASPALRASTSGLRVIRPNSISEGGPLEFLRDRSRTPQLSASTASCA